MFKKILIANRGEIAARIIRTCNDLGISSVAVYSQIDRKSPFVYLADEAYALQGKTSQESYLDINKIITLAKRSSAEAIHPGYGFLSENPEFAKTVREAGIVFIGPEAESMRLMGNKTAARQLMIEHNVPVVPGTQTAVSNPDEVVETARAIGYPLLIKAAAGGGGKGMRRVNDEDSIIQDMESATREAKAAFGDPSVYLEKYVEEPRHIEFQILADTHGNTIHLGERECSIQRRHQKIIEESPSSLLDEKLRSEMGQAAVRAAEACHYVNAGTIEFLLDKNRNFYFLEMNTRLQVEHPVTELVTGFDLVEEQIRIAAGKKLRKTKSLQKFWGHAIECRLYAEDPDLDFAPSPGVISHLVPSDGPGIREDSGVSEGSEISLYYDPMISKLIAWGEDRDQALRRMLRALREYEITGIRTIIPFLIRVLKHHAFKKGEFTTHFIDHYKKELVKEDGQLAEVASTAAIINFIQAEGKFVARVPAEKNCAQNWKLSRRLQNMGGR